MKPLVCKICHDIIGTVNLDNLSLPLRPMHFTPKGPGFPHPFNVMGNDISTCTCPYCKKIAIDEESFLISDSENGTCVITVMKEGGYEMEPYVDAAEKAAAVARAAHTQYSAIVAIDDEGIRIIPQEGVELDVPDGTVISMEVAMASDGSMLLIPATDEVEDDGSGSEDDEIAAENVTLKFKTVIVEDEGDEDDTGSEEMAEGGTGEDGIPGGTETAGEDTPAEGSEPDSEDAEDDNPKPADSDSGSDSEEDGTGNDPVGTWAIVVKDTGETFAWDGEPTSGLTEDEAKKALGRIRSKGNAGLQMKELD